MSPRIWETRDQRFPGSLSPGDGKERTLGTLGERAHAILLTHYLCFLYIQSIGSLVLTFFVVSPNSVPYQELNLVVNRTRTNKIKLFQ